jgi:hypothetical protein|tara:strand:- start:49 stop:417 length:369 start_codon:yes stop_codon:yes gene_type:complete
MKKLKILFILICAFQLFYLFYSRSNFKIEIFKNPFSKDAGVIYALSPAVIETNKILKKTKVSNFNLSDELIKDTYFYQRTIEFNYPIRLNKDSEFMFYQIKEEIPSGCLIVESGEFIKLIKC